MADHTENKNNEEVQESSRVTPEGQEENREQKHGRRRTHGKDSAAGNRTSRNKSEEDHRTRREEEEDYRSRREEEEDYRSRREEDEEPEDEPEKVGIGKILAIIFVVLLILVIGVYFAGSYYFRDHFGYRVSVNGNSVFGMTTDEVKSELEKDLDGYTLTITERTADGGTTTEQLTGSDVGLQLVFDDSLDQALASQSGIGWIRYALKGHEVTLEKMVEYDSTKWESAVNALQCFSDSFVEAPQDAYLSEYKEGVGFEIIPEVQGNTLNKDTVVAALSDAVLAMQETINLEDLNCYSTPAILSTDSSLTEKKALYDKYAGVTITYQFGDNTEVLDGNTIAGWLEVDDSNNVTLNDEKVSDFVATLRKKYDTIFRSRTFDTSYGETVTLDTGDYGWWMNYAQEAVELKEMILNGESGERTPVYYQTAESYGEHDYGNTYIECNLTAQHMFYYKDGEVVLESDFVSGKSTEERKTQEGVYGITYKERFATLKGANYETPVSYWMPFNGSQGLHDATWRTNFGSDYYLNNGSHGCINLPCTVAKELYSMVTAGTPVIVYSLPGTESDSVTKQSTQDIAQTCIDAFDAIPTVSEQKKQEVVEWMRLFYNEIGGSAQKLVTNYDILKEAEKEVKEAAKNSETTKAAE